MTTEQALLEKYKHDFWGKDTDESYQYSSLAEVIERVIEDKMEEQELSSITEVNGTFSMSGGDAIGSHFSSVLSDVDDAEEWLNACAESDWSAKRCAEDNSSELEERYYEGVMEGDWESFDPYRLEQSSARTIDRVFYRAAKAYQPAWDREDEAAMKRIANTFYRRFQRAVRHLPRQEYGMLTNYADYDVTVTNGIVTDVRVTREY